MMNILFDSDGLFALYVSSDSHHARAKALFQNLWQGQNQFYVSNLVLQETGTVLSHRFAHDIALDFLDRVSQMPVVRVFVNEKIEDMAWSIFREQKKKSTSFVDCSNLAILKHHGFDRIFSFDRFYGAKKME